MKIKAITYQKHIKDNHMKMTGEELAFNRVPCPTCSSMLVKRNRKGTPIFFVACDKTNKAYCQFSIGMNETLQERTRRIYNKLRHKDDVIDVKTSEPRLNGFGIVRR